MPVAGRAHFSTAVEITIQGLLLAWFERQKLHAKILVSNLPPDNAGIDDQRWSMLGSDSRNVSDGPNRGVTRLSILQPPRETSYKVPVPCAFPEKETGRGANVVVANRSSFRGSCCSPDTSRPSLLSSG